MTWRIPGAKPWVMNTVALTPMNDWEEGDGCGFLKYDDGTLWMWNGESKPSYWTSHIEIVELTPGSKAWECLTPDGWRETVGDLGLHASGTLIGAPMQIRHAKVVHDGGDRSFWFMPVADDTYTSDRLYNGSLDDQLGVFIVNKDRTWEWKTLTYGDEDYEILGQPGVWDDHIWWLTGRIAYNEGTDEQDTVIRLWRMSMDSPYATTLVRKWEISTTGDMRKIDPGTGLPYWFDNPMSISLYYNRASLYFATGVSDDGYMYRAASHDEYVRRPVGGDVPASGAALIQRLKLPYGDWETLYYDWEPANWVNATMRAPNLPDGGTVGSYWAYYFQSSPLPTGLGINFYANRIEIRDGWLYYVDGSTTQWDLYGQAWGGGFMFCRIKLSDIEKGWVKHDSENPIIEVLSMTTGPYDSAYNWDNNNPGWEWRDGVNSLHAYPENYWIFDDDGSILFMHHEYPSWLLDPYNSVYPLTVLSRLKPAGALTLNLVFEGEELKGYGHVREVPSKTNVGTIELAGG